ncbi:MAG: VOC family protein [Candidatus Korobacteraceae bacterium]|jgi:catechol 2,3-dioxygenase-like lactoylglutathione lyase family enzyme
METTSAAKAEQPWSFKMVAPLEPGIVCIDMDRMLKFYTEVLGLKLVADAQTTPEMSTKFRATPHGYRIVRLQTPYGERIKLAQPKVPPVQNPVPEWVYERQGLAYFTFIVDDMKPILARLRANQVRLLSEEPVEVRKGVFAQFLLDPEGNYVEFVEFADIASYRPDLCKK